MASRVNRHGIPLYDPPERCVWPKCQSSAMSRPRVHLCSAHAEIVRKIMDEDNRRMQAELQARREEAGFVQRKPEPARPARNEVIYYVQIGGHIKIGWTSRLDQRMRNYPPNTVLLAVHPGSREEERNLHRRFAVHRSHGNEWYPLVPVLLDHIKRMVTQHGEPPTMIFGARPVEVRQPKAKPHLRANYGPMLRGG